MTDTGAAGFGPELLVHGLGELRKELHFDSMQLLRRGPGDPTEVLRLGYSPHSARALAVGFSQRYQPGFTERFGNGDQLPISISASLNGIGGDFYRSTLFQDALGKDGYRDGITLELRQGTTHIGLAHFSSLIPDVYGTRSRVLAQAISGLLTACVALRAVNVLEPESASTPPLTRQQRRVLTGIVQGHGDLHIAAELRVSVRTVHSHVSAVLRRLGVATRVEAAVLAVRQGWTEPQ